MACMGAMLDRGEADEGEVGPCTHGRGTVAEGHKKTGLLCASHLRRV